MWRTRRPLTLILSLTAGLIAATLPVAAAQSDSTALDRAREVASEAALNASSLFSDDVPEKVTGRERAAQAIAAALERRGDEGEDGGNGHGWGRGHSAAVHEILAAGGSPSEIAGEHGQAVREMVHAYNALKKQSKQVEKGEKGKKGKGGGDEGSDD